jgi:hypothetical protein
MTEKKSSESESRRKLLKSIAAGSGAIVAGKSLPDSWSRPIVESVLLPAHAQTSGEEEPPTPSSGCTGGTPTPGTNLPFNVAPLFEVTINPAPITDYQIQGFYTCNGSRLPGLSFVIIVSVLSNGVVTGGLLAADETVVGGACGIGSTYGIEIEYLSSVVGSCSWTLVDPV